jgi:hypothetical protein
LQISFLRGAGVSRRRNSRWRRALELIVNLGG